MSSTSATSSSSAVADPPDSALAELLSHSRTSVRLVDVIDRLYAGEEVFFRYIHSVADLMCEGVSDLTLDDNLQAAVDFVKEHGVRHVPVVEVEEDDDIPEEQRKRFLVGIVSQRDLARAVPRNIGTMLESDEDREALRGPLVNVITRNPRAVTPSTALFEAVQAMVDAKISCFPVIASDDSEEKELIGIITATDIIKCFSRLDVLRRTHEGKKPKEVRLIDLARGGNTALPAELLADSLMNSVSDVMVEKVQTLRTEETIRTAIEMFQAKRFRHLPVVDEQGALRGILSDRDVLRFLPPRAAPRGGGGKPDAAPQVFRAKLFGGDEAEEAYKDAMNAKVAEAMTKSPESVKPQTPLAEVAEMFVTRHFGAAPVTDDGGKVIGIVTETDILTAILALQRLVAKND